MKNIQLQIEENKLDLFLTIIGNLKDGIVKNLTIYNEDDFLSHEDTKKFHEEKRDLQKTLDDIENKKTEILPHEDVWIQIDNHTSQ